MTRYTMDAKRARELAKGIAQARRRWGKHVSPPYTVQQVMEALEILDADGVFDGPTAAELKTELTKTKRQLGMSKARETGLRNRLRELGETATVVTEEPSEYGDTLAVGS